MSKKNWIVLGVCTFIIIVVNQFFHYADMSERMLQKNSSRQEKSIESLLEIEKQKLISKCMTKEGGTQEFCQCLGDGVYSRFGANEMVISKSRLIKQSLLIIISLFIGFLIGAAWMYYDQQNEIRQLISESRALFESQRLTIDNQQEVYTLVINCGYDPQ